MIPGRIIEELSTGERFAIRSVNMPPRYSRIHKMLNENPLKTPFYTMKDVHAKTRIDPSEVNDFSKRMGFAGWKDLKDAYWAETVKKVEPLLSKKDLREIAVAAYKNADRREITTDSCSKCGFEHVFHVKREGWFLSIESGEAEPKIRYCPDCGKRLVLG